MVKSSTLVEVIVALVIITMFTAMFYGFTSKIKREINVEQKILAELLIKSAVNNALIDTSYIDAEYSVNSVRIEKKIIKQESTRVIILCFSAYNTKNMILSKKKLLVIRK